jgi:hypothetical protein
MGYLQYACEAQPVWIPDYDLAHLKAVAVTKLRRSESFTLTWVNRGPSPGRTTIWMQPSIPLRFEFDCAEPIPLDPEYLRRIAHDANSGRGVEIAVQEDAAPPFIGVAPPPLVAA